MLIPQAFRAFCELSRAALPLRFRPRTLQLPVTSRCDSRCATCGIGPAQPAGATDLNPAALKQALLDPFFARVQTVGFNGGEPSLHPDLPGLLDALSALPRLRRIYVISNGLHRDRVLSMMSAMKTWCAPRRVRLHLCVSLDGVGETHDRIRGVPGAFDRAWATLSEIHRHPAAYCDALSAGCTLSVGNIAQVKETLAFLEFHGIEGFFHPAVPNKRLRNFDDAPFSLLRDERARMLATEFFYGRFKKAPGWKNRLQAFMIHRYLLLRGLERLALCNYRRGDVTLSETLDLCLCATASDPVGNLRDRSASDLLRSGALDREAARVARHCPTCIHYSTFPSFRGLALFVLELLKPAAWLKYKGWAQWFAWRS